MIDELNNKYDELKKVIDILPVNTKANRKRKLDYLTEEQEEDNKRIEIIKNEILSRISKYDSLKVSPKIKQYEEELEKCNILNEWNKYNSSYEKMHLDYYLYQLHRYYKEDLDGVNACINKILESFKKVEIVLKKDDFDFNNYVALYMDKIINGATKEELASYFEELYWKNPEIIKIMEINFKSIYLKYEKKIDKYYQNRHDEFLKKHKDSELYDLRISISKELRVLNSKDKCLNFNRFANGEYSLADYNEDNIVKKREQYFANDSYKFTNLLSLYDVLNEYKVLIDYKYLLDDMKDRLDKKDTLKNSKANALKEITKEEGNLRKLNAKQNKKPLFGKKTNDEKWLFDYRNVVNNVIKYYDEFDNACFNDMLFDVLTKDSSILDVLKLICSNYLYFVNKTYELDENQDINDINQKFETLKNYINTNSFVLLNNIALLDEKQMKQLIVDKYNLEHINITLEQLLTDNIANTMQDFEKLINYENILASGISIDDVSLYLEYKKLI